jgi:hypothetical protein
VDQNVPILGTNVRAAEIADKSSVCFWNGDMYGVDMSKPGAQEYYNLWRISGDFGDDWGPLYAQFQRLKDWTPFRAPGHWPDADMLPLGNIRACHLAPRLTILIRPLTWRAARDESL